MDSLNQFKLVFDISPHPLILVDRSGEIALTNSKLNDLFDYQDGELIGKPIEILVPKEIGAHHEKLRDAYFDYPSSRKMGAGRDLHGIRKDGSMLPVEIGLNPVKTNEGVLVIATVLDITKRVKLEQRLKLAVDAAPNAMIMINAKGRIVLANRQSESVFGYTSDEILNLSIEDLMPERFRTKHSVFRNSFISDPAPRPMGKGRDLFGLRKDGTEFPLEIGLTPIETAEGMLVMSSVVDITERKFVESELRKKNASLAQLNNELTEFAYRASHDLKAPLVTVKGLAKIILEDLEDEDYTEVRNNTHKILKLSDNLSNLINDILLLTKADNMQGSVEQVDIAELLSDTESKFAMIIQEFGVELVTNFEHRGGVYSQPIRLRQSLENLISNGIKYSDPAKSERFVHVNTRTERQALIISIRDNGLGIPHNYRDELFTMFKRFHHNVASGSGLGLYLVKKHIDALGGTIACIHHDDGTEFQLRFLQTESE